MKIETKYQGTVEVSSEQHLHFPVGLPGFPEEQQYVLLPFLEELPYFILQSINTAELAFVVVDPYAFFADYEFQLNEASQHALQIEQPEDVATFVILTLKEPFKSSTANLQGPLVINMKKRMGKQLVLNDARYKTKHPLFQLMEEDASCSY
ncbi:flagellar assembly protein FliW [Cytobacillus kochii]|uniref:Flagellar assembly factor FliW n=1 Tax=Cytobacillus kochii TaxID=859143 RepID=A0A248TJJ7_9BACI|nr:flagellar assembly protein FliW [Cytobacillus kochii]ASV68260.1 flagellar assembly protein FliW [Cytobacillus kochii]